MASNVKVVKCKQINKNDWHVELIYKKKKYTDTFNLKGLEYVVENAQDKTTLKYTIQSAMLNAVKKPKQKKEADNASKINLEG